MSTDRKATRKRSAAAELHFLDRALGAMFGVDPSEKAERDSLRLRALFRAGTTARPVFASKGRAGSSIYRPVSGPVYTRIIRNPA